MGQRQWKTGPGCSCHSSRQAPHLKQREVVVQFGGRPVLGVQDCCLDSEGEAKVSELVEPQHQPQLLDPVGGRIRVRTAILQPPDPPPPSPLYPEPCFQGPSRLSSRPRGPRSCPSPCSLTRPLSAWSFPCSFSTASSSPSPGSYPCCHPCPRLQFISDQRQALCVQK